MTALAESRNGQHAPGCDPPARSQVSVPTARGYASGKDDYLRRLRKIEGQVRAACRE